VGTGKLNSTDKCRIRKAARPLRVISKHYSYSVEEPFYMIQKFSILLDYSNVGFRMLHSVRFEAETIGFHPFSSALGE
jgi:hypothetical protein